MKMKVKEVAEIVGISVRTLHYYDQIGLLSPKRITESGYRLYSEEDLEILQQILFFKELDFTLKDIKSIIYSPLFNRQEALILQRRMLVEKRDKFNQMIDTIDQTIKHISGKTNLSNKEKFAGISIQYSQFEDEARRRWGNQSVDEVNTKIKTLSVYEQIDLSNRWDMIFGKLASLRNKSADSKEVQITIKEWHDFLNENFSTYSYEAFRGLGQLYRSDNRFSEYIDQYGEGLVKLMSQAMQVYTNQQTEGEEDENNN